MKCHNPIRLASLYAEQPQRNRDRVKSKVNWYKTRWGRKDEWERH